MVQTTHPRSEWRLVQTVRPLFAFGSPLLKVHDAAKLFFVRPFVGPYGSVCPDFFQNVDGLVIYRDCIAFVD